MKKTAFFILMTLSFLLSNLCFVNTAFAVDTNNATQLKKIPGGTYMYTAEQAETEFVKGTNTITINGVTTNLNSNPEFTVKGGEISIIGAKDSESSYATNSGISTIKFDKDTGFSVSELEPSIVEIKMNSAWTELIPDIEQINPETGEAYPNLKPSGEESLSIKINEDANEVGTYWDYSNTNKNEKTFWIGLDTGNIKNNITNLNERLGLHDISITNLENATNTLNSDILNLNSATNTLNNSISDLDSRIRTNNIFISKIKQAINYETESPGLVYEERECAGETVLWVTGIEEDPGELLVIPAYHDGMKVQGIASNADFDYDSITTIVFWGEELECNPDYHESSLVNKNGNIQWTHEHVLPSNLEIVILPNVKVIPDIYFLNQQTITTLYAPNLEWVGKFAFTFNDIGDINLPSLKYAGTCAFAGNDTSSVNVPELLEMDANLFGRNIDSLNVPKVKRIRSATDTLRFGSCFDNLEFAYLPECEEIENRVFLGSSALTRLDAPNLKHIGKDNWLPGLEEIDFPQCTEWHAKVIKPEGRGPMPQTAYLENTSLTKVVLGAIRLDKHAFRKCVALESVELPNLIQGGDFAFYDCPNLKYVDMPNLIQGSKGMFENCKQLSFVNIPKCETILENMFYGCDSIENVLKSRPNIMIKNDQLDNKDKNACTNYHAVFCGNVKQIGKNAFSTDGSHENRIIGGIALQEKDIRDIASLDGKTIYAAGFQSGIWKSIDSGNSWNLIYDIEEINSISISENGEIVYICSEPYEQVYKSSDKGNTWVQIQDGWSFSHITTIDGNVIYASWGKYLYKSTNGGSSFNEINSWNSGEIYDISIKDNDTLYIGYSNGLKYSKDGGETWIDCGVNSDVLAEFKYISASTNDFIYAWCDINTDNGKQIWISYDNGETFTPIYRLDNCSLLRCSKDGKILYYSEDANAVYKMYWTEYNDNGTGHGYHFDDGDHEYRTAFVNRSIPANTQIKDIATYSGRVIFLIDVNHKCYVSYNSGKYFGEAGTDLDYIFTTGGSSWIYGAYEHQLFKIHCGEQNYDVSERELIFEVPDNGHIDAIGGRDNIICIAVAYHDSLYISTDNGKSFKQKILNQDGDNLSISVFNNIVYISDYDGDVLRVYNIDEDHWENISPSIMPWKNLIAVSSEILYARDENNFIIMSTDGGHNWKSIMPSLNGEGWGENYYFDGPLCLSENGMIYGARNGGDIYKFLPEVKAPGQITTINLDKVESIDESAFANQEQLREIYVPRCETIGKHAFKNCGSAGKAVYIDPVSQPTHDRGMLGATLLQGAGTRDVATADGQTVYVGCDGEKRGVWKSIDGGKTFKQVFDQIVDSISSPYSNIVYIANSGNAWKSMDGGENWTRLRELNHVASFENVVFGDYQNNIYKSKDFGENWEYICNQNNYFTDIAAINESSFYAICENAMIEIYINDNYNESINILDYGFNVAGGYGIGYANGFIYAGFDGIHIIRSHIDDLEHWEEIDDGSPTSWYGIGGSITGDTIFACYDNNSMLKLNGQTKTFEKTAFQSLEGQNAIRNVSAIDSLDGQTIYLQENSSDGFFSSTDGGTTWIRLPSFSDIGYDHISVLDNGSNNILFLTDDSNMFRANVETLELETIWNGSVNFTAIKAVVKDNKERIYAALANSKLQIIEEVEPGTWELVSDNIAPSDLPNFITSICIVGNDIYVNSLDEHEIWKTSDEGQNWTKIAETEHAAIWSFATVDGINFYYQDDDSSDFYRFNLKTKEDIDVENVHGIFEKVFSIDTNGIIHIATSDGNANIYKYDTSQIAPKESDINYGDGDESPKSKLIKSVNFDNVRRIESHAFANAGFGEMKFEYKHEPQGDGYYLKEWEGITINLPSVMYVASNAFENAERIKEIIMPKFGDSIFIEDYNGDLTAVTMGSREPNSEVGPHSIVQGENCIASESYTYAGGENTIASGKSSHAEGYHSMANNDYSWVWNGNTNVEMFADANQGTFNINPVGGASGFYIGTNSLQNYLDGVQLDLSEYSITINGDEQSLDSNPNFIIDIPAQVQSDWEENDSSSPAYIENKPTIPPDLSTNTITINGDEQMLSENPTYRLDKIENEISNNGLTVDLSSEKNELCFSNPTANATNYIVLSESDYYKLGKIIIYIEENPDENAYYDFSGALSDSFTQLEIKPWLTSTNNSIWKFELISPPGNTKWSCDVFKEYIKEDNPNTI